MGVDAEFHSNMMKSTIQLLMLSAAVHLVAACGGKSGQELRAEKLSDISEERPADRPADNTGQSLPPRPYVIECSILNHSDSAASAAILGCNVSKDSQKIDVGSISRGPMVDPVGQVVTKAGQILSAGTISINLAGDYMLSFVVQGVSPKDVEDVQLTIGLDGKNYALVNRPPESQPVIETPRPDK